LDHVLLFAASGGVILGAVAGGVLGMHTAASWVKRKNIPDSLGAGFGIAIGIVLAMAIGAVVGAGFGGCLIGWLSTRHRGLAVILAALGYIAGVVVGWSMITARRESIRAVARVKAQLRGRQVAIDAAVAGYLEQARADLPALLGRLFYPGSAITPWVEAPVNRQYPLIHLTTREALDKVVDYYQQTAPGGAFDQGPSRHFHTTTYRPGDNRHVYIGVEPNPGYVRIGIALLHDDEAVHRDPQHRERCRSMPQSTPAPPTE